MSTKTVKSAPIVSVATINIGWAGIALAEADVSLESARDLFAEAGCLSQALHVEVLRAHLVDLLREAGELA